MAEAAQVAEKMLSDLRNSVSSLEKDVEELKSLDATSPEYEKKAKLVSELVTQALVKVDSVQISKDAAASALREGDRKTSRKLAVLLARRKTVVKKLNAMGDHLDSLTAAAAEAVGDEEVPVVDATEAS